MSEGPPRIAVRILKLLLPPWLREEALDELADLHALRVAKAGRRAADRWYRRQVVGYAVRLWLSGLGVSEGSAEPERLSAVLASADFFRVLGVDAAIGRTFAKGEDEPGVDNRIALLSHDYWQRRFGSIRDVVGQTITLDGQSYTTIGVLPDGEPWLDAGDVFLPLVREPDANRGSFELAVIGRMRADVTMDAARADLDAIATRLAEQVSGAGSVHGDRTAPSSTWVAEDGLRRALWILMGGVGLLLLIACVNLTNLLPARATGRTRERALRTALGAGRSRFVSLVLSESFVIGVLGALLGLGLAYGIVRLVQALEPGQIPRLSEVSIDGSVLAYTIGIAFIAAIVVGVVSALRTPHRDVVGALREGERSVAGNRRQGRLRAVLVGIEVAMSLVLLVGAGLLARSFGAVLSVNRGFDSENRIFLEVALPSEYDGDRVRRVCTAFFPMQ